MSSHEDILISIATDPKFVGLSVTKIRDIVNTIIRPDQIKLKDVEEFVNKTQLKQITHQRTKKNEVSFKIESRYVGYSCQMDLLDLHQVSKKNKGIKFLLTFIDVYSRLVIVYPLKNKSENEVSFGLVEILNEFEEMLHNYWGKSYRIENITSDNGNEFKNKSVRSIMKRRNITHWLNEPGDHNKMGIIERFHRTLRDRIRKINILNSDKVYIPYLDDLVNGYNQTPHKSLGASPMHVFNGMKLPKEDGYVRPNEMEIGSYVRKRLRRRMFEKGNDEWSKKIYQVTGIDEKFKNKYIINDDTNKIYHQNDLQVVPDDTFKLDGSSVKYQKTPFSDEGVEEEDLVEDDRKEAANRSVSRKLKKMGISKSNMIKNRLRKRG